jgi:phosphopantothenoylcysteine decarboxylase / phosphopantothenate---cysteine ligase
MLKGKNIIIGVTGSIACYKVLEVIRKLKILGANVHIIMSQHARKLVDVSDFETACGNEVQHDLFHPDIKYSEYIKQNKKIKHISLADIADLFLICPATANIIGKLANGIADDLLTTSILATNAPVVICPAMNVKMWKHPIVQDNIMKLNKINYEMIDPEYGDLACGYKGVGRLANIDSIISRIESRLKKRSTLLGKKLLITAGATSEEIDPVRIITNKSSGKMGVFIAEEAFLRGADVILIRGSNSIEPRYHFKDIIIENVSELHNEIEHYIKGRDIVIHAAAVSDFKISMKKDKKIKSTNKINLELSPTTKILENIKKMNKHVTLIGFKAEYKEDKENLIDKAFQLLKSADADLIVANDVGKLGSGFNVDTNEVFVIDRKKIITHLKQEHKRVIANKILDIIQKSQ